MSRPLEHLQIARRDLPRWGPAVLQHNPFNAVCTPGIRSDEILDLNIPTLLGSTPTTEPSFQISKIMKDWWVDINCAHTLGTVLLYGSFSHTSQFQQGCSVTIGVVDTNVEALYIIEMEHLFVK